MPAEDVTAGCAARSEIMIVDDKPANLKLLEDMLLQQGHRVRSFPLGRLAMAAAANRQPDLVLLDINMPEMDGYEVCAHFKATPCLAAIPIIFLSALSGIEDKVKAFRSGAADYISKPFQIEEVHARVKTHLDLNRLHRALERQNEKLELAVAERTVELLAANERLTGMDRSKSAFLSLLSHEFRTPLSGLLGVSSMILHDMPPTDLNIGLKAVFERARRRILAILEDALLLARIENSGAGFIASPVSLPKVVEESMEGAAEFAESREVKLSAHTASLGMAAGNHALLVRALNALIETSVKFSAKGGSVDVRCCSLEIAIESRGRVIPPDALPNFFNVFSIEDAITPGGDLGVGPPLAFRILSLCGASLRVDNLDPAGVRFTIVMRDGGSRSN